MNIETRGEAASADAIDLEKQRAVRRATEARRREKIKGLAKVDRDAYQIDEVCARLGGISRRHFYNLARDRGLTVSHVGSTPMVFHEDLVAFLDTCRAPR